MKINANPKKGVLKTQTNYDMVVLFLLFFLPMGIYIWSKKNKQKKMEVEVADAIRDILNVQAAQPMTTA